MAVLAVVPSDPLAAYEAKGTQVWLERYYNPKNCFEKVYLFSPLEKEPSFRYGMEVVPTPPRRLRNRIRKRHIDVVRAYGGYWACDYACNHKVRGVPVVVSVHDTNPKELYPSIRRADYVICMSEAVRRLVLTRYRHPERVWTMPNRIDTNIMHRAEGDCFDDLNAEYPWRRRLLCVGRLSEQKNQDTLVRALALLPGDYGCVFVGRNDANSLKTLAAEFGVADRCRFVPSIRNDVLPRYYSWADCMVTPSRWEGFGLVFIEALACGAVVVTSNVAPMNEYIEHEENGLLVDAYENPTALADGIRRACEDGELRDRLRRNGPPSVRQFSREVVDGLEVEYYRRILADKEANPPKKGLLKFFFP